MTRHARPRVVASSSRALARALSVALVAFGTAFILASCAGGSAPAWTYAPIASPKASPAASRSPATAASPSAEPGRAGATVLELTAHNIAFNVRHLSVPANRAFQIAFDNEDAGIPHDVEILGAGGRVIFRGQIITGVAQTTYSVPPLPAGTYTFQCVVHPSMTGTLTVQ